MADDDEALTEQRLHSSSHTFVDGDDDVLQHHGLETVNQSTEREPAEGGFTGSAFTPAASEFRSNVRDTHPNLSVSKTSLSSSHHESSSATNSTKPTEVNPFDRRNGSGHGVVSGTAQTVPIAPRAVPESQDDGLFEVIEVVLHTQPQGTHFSRATSLSPSRIQINNESETNCSSPQPAESNPTLTSIISNLGRQVEFKPQNVSLFSTTNHNESNSSASPSTKTHNPQKTTTTHFQEVSTPVAIKTELDVDGFNQTLQIDATKNGRSQHTALSTSAQNQARRRVIIPIDDSDSDSSVISSPKDTSTTLQETGCSDGLEAEMRSKTGKMGQESHGNGNEGTLQASDETGASTIQSQHALPDLQVQLSLRDLRSPPESNFKNQKKDILIPENEITFAKESSRCDLPHANESIDASAFLSNKTDLPKEISESEPSYSHPHDGENSKVNLVFRKNEAVFAKSGYQGNAYEAVVLEDVLAAGDDFRPVSIQWSTLMRKERVPLCTLIKFTDQRLKRTRNVTDRYREGTPMLSSVSSPPLSRTQPVYHGSRKLPEPPPIGNQSKRTSVATAFEKNKIVGTHLPLNLKSSPGSNRFNFTEPDHVPTRKAFLKNDIVIVKNKILGTEYDAVVLEDVPEGDSCSVLIRCLKRRLRKRVPVCQLNKVDIERPGEPESVVPVCYSTKPYDHRFELTDGEKPQSFQFSPRSPRSKVGAQDQQPLSPRDLWETCSDSESGKGVFHLSKPPSRNSSESDETVWMPTSDNSDNRPGDPQRCDSENAKTYFQIRPLEVPKVAVHDQEVPLHGDLGGSDSMWMPISLQSDSTHASPQKRPGGRSRESENGSVARKLPAKTGDSCELHQSVSLQDQKRSFQSGVDDNENDCRPDSSQSEAVHASPQKRPRGRPRTSGNEITERKLQDQSGDNCELHQEVQSVRPTVDVQSHGANLRCGLGKNDSDWMTASSRFEVVQVRPRGRPRKSGNGSGEMPDPSKELLQQAESSSGNEESEDDWLPNRRCRNSKSENDRLLEALIHNQLLDGSLAFHKNEVVFAKDGIQGIEYDAIVMEDVPAGDDFRLVLIRWGTQGKRERVPIGSLTKIFSRPSLRARKLTDRWTGPAVSVIKRQTCRKKGTSPSNQHAMNGPQGDDGAEFSGNGRSSTDVDRNETASIASAHPSGSSTSSQAGAFSKRQSKKRRRSLEKPLKHVLVNQEPRSPSNNAEPPAEEEEDFRNESFSQNEHVFVKDGSKGVLYNAVVLEDVPALEAGTDSVQQQQHRFVWIRWTNSKREYVPVRNLYKLPSASDQRPKRQRQVTNRYG